MENAYFIPIEHKTCLVPQISKTEINFQNFVFQAVQIFITKRGYRL